MATKQVNTAEAIVHAVAEAARVAVQAMAAAEAQDSTRHEGTQNVGPKIGRVMLKQPTFNWEEEDKYNETKDFDKIKTEEEDWDKQKENWNHMPKSPQNRIVVIVVPAIHPDNAQPMVRDVQSAAR